MAAPYSKIRSKLDRAVVAYLISAGVGTDKNIYPSNRSATMELPHLVVVAQNGRREVPMSGLYRFTVKVMMKFPAAQPADQVNPEANRVAADNMIARAADALMQSDDDQTLRKTAQLITAAGRTLATAGTTQSKANNADMADFTCTAWYDIAPDGGQPEDESSSWVEVAAFDAVCCPSNVD